MCGLMRSAIFAAVVLASCGGSAKSSFDGNVFRRGPVAFSVPGVPQGWRRVDVDDQSLSFHDDTHDGSVLVNARCMGADDRTPLVALRNHLLIGATERKFDVEETIPFDGREALHTRVRAKWDGVPMLMDTYVLSKDGCIYDFVYTERDDGTASPALDVFERWVKGFKTLAGSGAV